MFGFKKYLFALVLFAGSLGAADRDGSRSGRTTISRGVAVAHRDGAEAVGAARGQGLRDAEPYNVAAPILGGHRTR